ncbi:TetR/AcrR family transcriptional regulator [Acholeplasma vituli]|uniref:TetR/AcrR family transcriptional regulator n=1 Tax=Paracholeplasma vituli TaxID=69473 RepID=A0ABT2PXM2_9MOLU|nr:TetR/AcrR family transcriptional regulator [Paracholeplasma vituli]MCU0105079.1 TetR/AcrR family transcriptional regulator [Paracholeplasma vituli]
MNKDTYRYPKTPSGIKTFNKIVATGKKLFAKNGFQATSINDIIAKSKIAAGTFYIYFDSKLALYLYILDLYRVSIRKASAEATKGMSTRYDIERAGIKAFISYALKDPLAYRIIWESLFVDFDIFKNYYESFADAYIKHLKEFVEKGEIREDLDLETLSYTLMGISNFVGLQVIFKENKDESELNRIIDEAMSILDQGIFKNKRVIREYVHINFY